jgi:DNA topoisomerase-3
LKKTIKSGGLGTPATRADIIEKLLRANYISREGKSLRPTKKAFELIKLVPEELRFAELTARWEKKLELIAKGDFDPKKFSKDIREKSIQMIEAIKNSEAKYTPPNLLKQKCPVCGGKEFEKGNR